MGGVVRRTHNPDLQEEGRSPRVKGLGLGV